MLTNSNHSLRLIQLDKSNQALLNHKSIVTDYSLSDSALASIHESNQYDIIYFDAFAPNAQPELWDVDLLAKMYRALKKGGILTTYCAKGQVKRNLKSLGFTIESIPGPPGKREMTRAIKPL